MGFSNSRVSSLLSSLPYFYLFVLLHHCMAIDTISSSHSIIDGETLVSAKGVFELGFFSPGNSTNRYVGIWYKKTSYTQVVSVLNSMKPITDSSPGTLAINGSEGNSLVLLDGKQNVIWYTNASSSSSGAFAVLDDLGNFVLKDPNGLVLWQSFDHPSNTFIPNMRLGGNDELRTYLTVTSWVSENDPTPGNFFLNRDRKSLQQIFVIAGSVDTVFNWTEEVEKHWRSGQWNGRSFIGVPGMSQSYINGYTFTEDGYGGQYYTYSDNSNSSVPRTSVLDSSGNLISREWDEEKKEWVDVWFAINSQCDFYGTCGAYGICNKMESSICSCMRGFKPKFPEKWRNGNWSDGCVRSSELQCSSGQEGFLKLPGMKLPDFADYLQVQDVNECQVECLNNCSCVAYAYVSGPGCLVWIKALIDVQQFPFDGQELYLRLPSSELGNPRKIRVFVVLLPTILGICTLILVSIVYLMYRYKKKQNGACKKFQNTSSLVTVSQNSSPARLESLLKDSGMLQEDQELQLFDFSSIELATNNFSFENKIGEGGFGIVYKGDLPTGQAIAIKRLSRTSGQGMIEFKNEATLISKLQHKNLVKLVGVCIERDERLLLYEYLHNKSLDTILFNPIKRAELDWTKRFRIIEGIASGLLYLHRDSRLKVIHRDLKASNILLDEELIPKISDFGMARIFSQTQDLENTNRVVGTYGYMAPEYAIQGIFSEKSDVFSFGILLLEIVSGIKNNSFHGDEKHSCLVGYAWQLWEDNKGMQLIDETIVNSSYVPEAMRCMHIGLLCVQQYAADRPTMSKVIFMLSTTATLLPPKMPGYTKLDSYGSTDVNSVNICSISTLVSR